MSKQFKLDKVNALLSGAEQQMKQRELVQKVEELPDITIFPEFQNLIPPLTDEEYYLLEHNLLEEGCRDPLVIWPFDGKNILIDGHNRFQICRIHNIPFQTVIRNFPSEAEARDWIIINQLGKRNITEESKSYLRGLQYKREKQKKGGTGANQYSRSELSGSGKTEGQVLMNTAEKIASLHQVSDRTIRNDEKFADAINKIAEVAGAEVKTKILGKQFKAGRTEILELVNKTNDEIVGIIKHLYTGKASDLRHAINLAKPVQIFLKKQETIKSEQRRQDSDKIGENIQLMLDEKSLSKIQSLPNIERASAIESINTISRFLNWVVQKKGADGIDTLRKYLENLAETAK